MDCEGGWALRQLKGAVMRLDACKCQDSRMVAVAAEAEAVEAAAEAVEVAEVAEAVEAAEAAEVAEAAVAAEMAEAAGAEVLEDEEEEEDEDEDEEAEAGSFNDEPYEDMMEDEHVDARADESPAASSSTAGSTHRTTAGSMHRTTAGSTHRNRPKGSGRGAQAKKMDKVMQNLRGEIKSKCLLCHSKTLYKERSMKKHRSDKICILQERARAL
eukprot:6801146-Prymnesium_polylepis.1